MVLGNQLIWKVQSWACHGYYGLFSKRYLLKQFYSRSGKCSSHISVEHSYGNSIPAPSVFFLYKVLSTIKCDSFVARARGYLSSLFLIHEQYPCWRKNWRSKRNLYQWTYCEAILKVMH